MAENGPSEASPEAEAVPPSGKVYTVFSPRGGSGKTMIAVNLAVSMAKAHPDQVCLLDLSLTFGHCAMTLNAAPRPSLATINAESLPRMDAAGIERYLSAHLSSLKLMVGSNTPEEGDAVTTGHVHSIIGLLKQTFPVVIIDTPSAFNEPTIAALESSDRVIMVSTLELSTLRDISISRRIITELIKVPAEQLFWVMNNVFPFKVLAMEAFVENLDQAMDVEIPHGNDAPAKSATAGSPLVLTQTGSPVAKAIAQMGKTLEAEAFPQQGQEKRGLFGRH